MPSVASTIIDLQIALTTDVTTAIPAEADFQVWANAALREAGVSRATEITVRVVDADESRTLNRDYREKDKPTNVLSFPNELPDFLRDQFEVLPLGDLVICAAVVLDEAAEQDKTTRDHWAHLTVHGILHLLGFDHINDTDAEEMEAKEISALQTLGIANPYEPEHDINNTGKPAS
jgi:probable rRNA maturation factor